MNKTSTLDDLARRIEEDKSRQMAEIKHIESEKLSELSELLRERLNKELHTIEEDMTTRLYDFKEKLTKARSTIVDQRTEITGEIEDLNRRLTKIKSKQWIIPTVIGISIVAGLAIGSWSLGAYATHQLQVIEDHKKTIVELEQLIKEQNKAKDKWIKKTWSNAIGVKQEPKVYPQDGLWIVQFE